MHLGSLLAAAGSYLDALTCGGHWLLRLEDLDRTRNVPGCDSDILRTLERYGFEWSGPVVRQSERVPLYEEALRTLGARGETFYCGCSRRDIAAEIGATEPRCIGDCRRRGLSAGDAALRYQSLHAQTLALVDLMQGGRHWPAGTGEQFVVRRRDGIVAYHLAVTVDDQAQGVTHVVRGADLLDSTPCHLRLQRSLGFERPQYGHLPLVVEPDGTKLAKSRRSVAIGPQEPAQTLSLALTLLRLPPPLAVTRAGIPEIWRWARGNWNRSRLQGCAQVRAP
jgi:glutamyl-Q tRNA(Asp) synthetase